MTQQKTSGLNLKTTPALLALLEKAASDEALDEVHSATSLLQYQTLPTLQKRASEDCREFAERRQTLQRKSTYRGNVLDHYMFLFGISGVPSSDLQRTNPADLRCRGGRSSEVGVPLLQEVCQGSEVVIPQGPVKQRNPELVARLEKLQRKEEERKYSAMVHDVTAAERKADSLRDNSLVSYKDQLGYGVHVVVVMGVFYGIGHLAATRLSPKPSVAVAVGLLGMIFAMLMEAVLLIIRTSDFGKKKQQHGKSKSKPGQLSIQTQVLPQGVAMPAGVHQQPVEEQLSENEKEPKKSK